MPFRCSARTARITSVLPTLCWSSCGSSATFGGVSDESERISSTDPEASQEQSMKVASYLSPKTSVKQSGIAGRGLYANTPIARGEMVSVKGGHLIDRATRERNKAVINDADMQIADDLFLAPLTGEEFE